MVEIDVKVYVKYILDVNRENTALNTRALT
jgi:hypothetical protein